LPNLTANCKYCKAKIVKAEALRVPLGYFCDTKCAYEYQLDKRQASAKKAVKKDIAIRKEKLKTVSDYAAEAQTSVNAYIRLRDKGKPCISCDRPDTGDHQRHASHYRSRGACSQLRFNLDNIHASCATCNNHQSGNLIEYRIRLIKKLGSEKVQWLESQNEITRYSKSYLIRLNKVFKKRVKQLKKRRQHEFI